MSRETKRIAGPVAWFAACAFSMVPAAIGLASCGSGTVTVRSAGQQTEAPTSAASSSSASIPVDSGVTTDGIDVDALHAKVVGYLDDHPDATITGAVAARTDRSSFLALSGDTDDAQAQGTPVVVLQLRGQFPTLDRNYSMQKQPGTGRLIPVPSASPRMATVITESMSLDLSHVYDVATQYSDSTIIDLSKLNVPMVEIPIN